MPNDKPEYELRLHLENGAAIRPHLASMLKRLGRGYRIKVTSIRPANDAARRLTEPPKQPTTTDTSGDVDGSSQRNSSS
jgi:hypothetical protein